LLVLTAANGLLNPGNLSLHKFAFINSPHISLKLHHEANERNSRQAPVVKCKKAKSEDFFLLFFRAEILNFCVFDPTTAAAHLHHRKRDFCLAGFMINLYHYTCRSRRHSLIPLRQERRDETFRFWPDSYLRRRIETLENRSDHFFLAPNSSESSVCSFVNSGQQQQQTMTR
jgi:hypothetical protein